MNVALVAAIAFFGAVSSFLIAFSTIPPKNMLRARMRKLDHVQKPPELRKLVVERVISKERASKLRGRLREAGWYELTPTALAIRGLGAVGLGISFGAFTIIFFHNNRLGTIMGLLLALVGWRLPSIILARAIKARKELISRDLPDFIDLLCTTVQAGMSLNAAMLQAVDATTGPLKEELTSTLSEIRLGRSRAQSLQAMAERVNENSLSTMVTAVVLAEKLGSNIADVLQEVSKESRDRRWMRAEEKAAQLPVKMIIPMAMFMIPSLYLMIFGPVIAQFFASK